MKYKKLFSAFVTPVRWKCALGLSLAVLLQHEWCAAEDKAIPPETAAAEQTTLSFEKHIAPIFSAKCVQCHGEKIKKSELDLSTPQGLLKGGSSGEAIVAHKPDESLLYDYIESGQMPPEKIKDPEKRLTELEIKVIHDWIASGARFADPHSDAGASKNDTITEDEITPLVLTHCTVCHGLRKQEAGLDLRTRESMLVGGRSGPAIVPGKPDESLILKRLHAGEMPPKRRLVEVSVKPMDPSGIDLLTNWIARGAPAGSGHEDVATTEPDPLVSEEERQFWAFQPPKPMPPPSVQHTDRVRNPIDSFVWKQLEAAELSMAPEAELRTLVRRAYFDLTGLPPEPAEMEAVVSDSDPQAYEKLIDRLLASPRYGERWGRYWLDLAGYADSEGKTYPDYPRPFAYRYRDYVIRAFNSDKPYDRFLLEQLAGDELADYENAKEITPEIYDNLVATGFLRMAPDGTSPPITNYVPDRVGVIADQLQVLGSSVLGLTLHCARCHTHKFDPIPHRDYYRMMAVFKPAADEHDWLTPSNPEHKDAPFDLKVRRFLPWVLPDESAPVEAHNRPLLEQIAALEAEKKQAGDAVRERLLKEYLDNAPETEREALSDALATTSTERSGTQRMTIEAMAERFDLDEKMLQKDTGYKQKAATVDKQIAELRNQLKPVPLIQALWDRGTPSPTYILRRGESTQPTRRVGPGVLSALTDGKTPFEVAPPWPGAKSTGRRLAFAKWLIEPQHPLTSRVMANRIWLHHFGRGLVSTPDNFGRTGAKPTHPELLDWLAIEFIQKGWSIKAMHRLIMTSSTYRQSSTTSKAAQQRDPDNSLLSRMTLRRLDAESIRDSILQIASRLDDTPFGPPDPVQIRTDGLATVAETNRGWRRSIYVRQYRTELPTLLESFDLPQMSPNCVGRTNSTVAPQALQLLNDAQIYQLANHFAKRIARDAGSDLSSQIDRAYQIALGRPPTDEDQSNAQSTLAELTEEWTKQYRQEIVAVESAAELWIRESTKKKVYEDDLIYIHSRAGRDKARRFSLVEFDLTTLPKLPLEEARLELSPVQASQRVRQSAAIVPHGIRNASWQSFQADKESSLDPLESLGMFDIAPNLAHVGRYCASDSASSADLRKLEDLIVKDGRLALALMAPEDGNPYQAEWDDGKGVGTGGKRPRLVLRFKSPSAAQGPDSEVIQKARESALANYCHALLNSAELVYVD